MPARRRALQQFGHANSDRVFRAAVRHSQRVRFVRVAIPAAAAAAVAGLALFTVLAKPLRALSKMPVELGSVVVSGSKIMMQQPRIAGFTPDNRRYNLTAQIAGRDVTKPDMVELQGIHATIEMQDKSVFETTAQSGLYNTKSEQLTLSRNVVVTSSSGYQAMLSEATLDIRGGKITSEQPVELKSAAWIVNANRMEVAEGGSHMRFEHGVTFILLPEEPAPRPTAKAGKP
jgi:lipopolysaccharide export system protein LptC